MAQWVKALATNPEFEPQNRDGGRRDPVLTSCPLSSTSATCDICVRMHTHTNTYTHVNKFQ